MLQAVTAGQSQPLEPDFLGLETFFRFLASLLPTLE